MRKPIILILILIITSAAARATDYGAHLARLDSVIDASPTFEAEKVRRIDELKQRLVSAATLSERYAVNNMLYNEYKTFNVDSAINYVNANIDIARMTGDKDWMAAEQIKKSFLLAATGLLAESLDAISSVDSSKLGRDLKKEYFGQMIYLYSHLGNFVLKSNPVSHNYYEREKEYKDSINAIISPADRDYLWYQGWQYLGTDDARKKGLIDSLKIVVDINSMLTREDAMKAYMLARLCQSEGMDDDYVRYMAASAIGDIRSANRDIASVEELAKYLFNKGDIDHAHSYINYALQAALHYPNRVRTIGMAQVFDEITRAYRDRDRQRVSRIHFFFVLVVILSLIQVCAIAIIVIQKKRLRAHTRSLDSANRRLNDHVAELREAHDEISRVNARLNDANSQLSEYNNELTEANYLKEEYLGYVFAICSKYIKKNEDFRKTIARKCKARQYDDIRSLAESTTASKDELKDFYHDFDSVFLKIYPDFIDDFNALLQPDERIVPKEGELLNTELRIYALVRLGITDSVKIAEFLHCSPQTVYNNRFRVRGKSSIAKEDFARTVQALGKGKLTPRG